MGRVEGHCIPPLTTELQAILSEENWQFYRNNAKKGFPLEVVTKAKEEIEYFCTVLEREGIKVRRPDISDYEKGHTTPDFHSPRSLYKATPRFAEHSAVQNSF